MRIEITDGEKKIPVALVGKGITYDSGGLNLKPTGSMESMHMDMCGAAAVLGTASVVAKLAPNFPICSYLFQFLLPFLHPFIFSFLSIENSIQQHYKFKFSTLHICYST